MTKTRNLRRGVGFASTMLAIALVGSSAMLLAGCGMENPIMSYGPQPRAEDCAIIQQATPAKFVCDPGAVTCTANELYAIRQGKPIDSKSTCKVAAM